MEANRKSKFFFVPYKSILVRIDPINILYLSAAGSYCHIHLANDVIDLSSNLAHVFNYVSDEDYLLRLNRSIVINIEHVNRVMGNMLVLSNGEKLSVGDSAINKFTEHIIIIR